MQQDDGHTVSKPIPIGNRSSRSPRKSDVQQVAKSAPEPRTPIIGSLPAPSYLAQTMPRLELPPPSEDSKIRTTFQAQSAPTGYLSMQVEKPVLHAYKIRRRNHCASFSSINEDEVDCDIDANEKNKLGNTTDDLLLSDASGSDDADTASSMEVLSTIRSLSYKSNSTPLQSHMTELNISERAEIPGSIFVKHPQSLEVEHNSLSQESFPNLQEHHVPHSSSDGFDEQFVLESSD